MSKFDLTNWIIKDVIHTFQCETTEREEINDLRLTYTRLILYAEDEGCDEADEEPGKHWKALECKMVKQRELMRKAELEKERLVGYRAKLEIDSEDRSLSSEDKSLSSEECCVPPCSSCSTGGEVGWVVASGDAARKG